jgi:hypothetical protein
MQKNKYQKNLQQRNVHDEMMGIYSSNYHNFGI